MRARRVGLVDIGLDAGFDASMAFVQGTLQNLNAGYDEPVVEIDFVRSRDWEATASALTSECHVLHVMAHGDAEAGPMFISSDGKTEMSIADLHGYCLDTGRGIATSTILADGCRTGTGVWQRAFRDCLRGPITYIGTSAYIGWHEATVFSSAFYGALVRNKGRGTTPSAQAEDAARRAIAAYEKVTDRKCPFRAVTLTPSRAAKGLT